VDCGPAWTTSLHHLGAALAAHGRRLEDVELLLITHQHLDHLGLASTVAGAGRARVASLDLLAPYAAAFDDRVDEDDAAAAQLMRRHGVPRDVVDVLRAVTRVNRHWGVPVDVDRRVPHGGVVELASSRLRVVHVPGHSPTDTLFVDEERGIAFSGDHLLADVSSNALVASRPPDAPRLPRYPALATYIESLCATRELELTTVLPGHGRAVVDHRALIDERLEQYESRAAQILELIRQRPRSAHELAGELWGRRRAVAQAYLTTSEILGHVDLLLERGHVREVDDGETSRFEAR
jgi:glyoxylase-like metal-dependent hydrolase (beta-lactamase superfamily II)